MATCKNRSGVCIALCVNEDIQLTDQRVSDWFKLNPEKLKVQISKFQRYSTLLKMIRRFKLSQDLQELDVDS